MQFKLFTRGEFLMGMSQMICVLKFCLSLLWESINLFLFLCYRIQSYFSDILNSVDAVIIVVTLLVNIVYIFYIICVIEILKDITR